MACDPSDDESTAGQETDMSPKFVEFDPETDSVTERITSTVLDLAETSLAEVEPLYDVVDTDVLDTMIRSMAARSEPCSAEIKLRYHGYTITVHSYGVIEFAPR